MLLSGKIQILAEIKEEDAANPYLELLYVPEGRVRVLCGGGNVALRAGDLFFFEPNEPHSAVSVGRTHVVRLLFDMSESDEGYLSGQSRFHRQAFLENETDCRRVVSLVIAILRETARKNRLLRLKLLYYSVFDLIVHGYLRRTEREAEGPLGEILEDLAKHNGTGGSLAEYAAKLFLSEATFSRRFQRAAGQSFSDYTSMLRTRRAAELLWSTDASVSAVAAEAGFGSSTVMQRHFRKQYGCTPSEYRKRRDRAEGGTPVGKEELKGILDRIEELQPSGKSTVRVSVSGLREPLTPKKEMHCVYFGEARWLLDGDSREQLLDTSRVLGLRYIEVGSVFDPFFRIRHGHAVTNLHFERLDRALDQILSCGCIPVLLLPESRNVIVREIGNLSEDAPEERIFANPEEWESVFRAFLLHVLERHTYAAVRNWIFVMRHDPFWESDEDCRFFREVYRRTFRLLRRHVPGARIWAGGLNTTVLPAVLEEDLRVWKEEGLLPDALDLMIYPYRISASKNRKQNWEFSLLRIDADLHFVKEELAAYKELAARCGCGQLPTAVSEWNTSLSERNPYNDSCAKACHMLAQMADASEYAEMMFFRGFSDMAVSGFEEAEPLIGAAALLSRDGIRKPSFYAMEFWGRLGRYVVSRGEHHVVATDYGAVFQILLFHPTRMSEEYKLIPESEHRMDELVWRSGQDDLLRFELRFPELAEKKKMRVYHMSDREGAVFTEWQRIGKPSQLSPSELRYLKEKSTPSLRVQVVRPDDGGIALTAELEPNAFSLILLG